MFKIIFATGIEGSDRSTAYITWIPLGESGRASVCASVFHNAQFTLDHDVLEFRRDPLGGLIAARAKRRG